MTFFSSQEFSVSCEARGLLESIELQLRLRWKETPRNVHSQRQTANCVVVATFGQRSCVWHRSTQPGFKLRLHSAPLCSAGSSNLGSVCECLFLINTRCLVLQLLEMSGSCDVRRDVSFVQWICWIRCLSLYLRFFLYLSTKERKRESVRSECVAQGELAAPVVNAVQKHFVPDVLFSAAPWWTILFFFFMLNLCITDDPLTAEQEWHLKNINLSLAVWCCCSNFLSSETGRPHLCVFMRYYSSPFDLLGLI